ncbi:hypothetical protein Rsub_02750 [Raphidocelis subcapitata]|uniref:Inward rectifier potassium channel C-terminal domain-containing protein n=1 Tax=Raphidocelis subcapitata TaxID=307507 RepID=A0A2V0NTP2_9CHLO|nr:hypothetical protein Rsub_02750 [Raphidocelis subcapitata]|eukprot:GBF90042.1 hypothetical protein Rsub_02750 [Raphidocelis subcapitata]
MQWLRGLLGGGARRAPSAAGSDALAASLLTAGSGPDIWGAASFVGGVPSSLMAGESESSQAQARNRKNPMWTLDRGSGYYQAERHAKKKASLLGSGRDAGKSRVEYSGVEWARLMQHVWRRDFFTTAIHARFHMFRVADIRKRTAQNARIRAILYTWSPGRATAEGEPAELAIQELSLQHHDPLLLMPVVAEHTIDERSPLYGHTHESLEACGAEVVVTFDGVNELGYTFTARRSYLPSEMHWGHTFVAVIARAARGATRHAVDLARFHEVEPQPGFGPALLPPPRLSRAVVAGAPRARALPPCRLMENTLALAEEMVVSQR